jgi:hypothetical protein
MLRCFVWPAFTRRFAPPELSYLTGRESEASPLPSGSLDILSGGVVPSSRGPREEGWTLPQRQASLNGADGVVAHTPCFEMFCETRLVEHHPVCLSIPAENSSEFRLKNPKWSMNNEQCRCKCKM